VFTRYGNNLVARIIYPSRCPDRHLVMLARCSMTGSICSMIHPWLGR
jgi:hypothetical protein